MPHPNLLQIHHVGKTATHLFYVMDPADDVSGEPASDKPDYRPATLQSRLQNGPLRARCLLATTPGNCWPDWRCCMRRAWSIAT